MNTQITSIDGSNTDSFLKRSFTLAAKTNCVLVKENYVDGAMNLNTALYF